MNISNLEKFVYNLNPELFGYATVFLWGITVGLFGLSSLLIGISVFGIGFLFLKWLG